MVARVAASVAETVSRMEKRFGTNARAAEAPVESVVIPRVAEKERRKEALHPMDGSMSTMSVQVPKSTGTASHRK